MNDEHGTKVNTHTIVVANPGKRTANNVRVGHAYLPTAYSINPPIHYEIASSDDGKAEILIPTLVPNEQVSISYLYFPPNTWHRVHSYCKSDEMMADYVNVIPSKPASKIMTAISSLILFIGASTLLYWILTWGWGIAASNS